MKLSTRGTYGTRALLDLAIHQEESPVLLKDIARRQQIPQAYLEHLVAPLIAAGLVWSTRGAKGGISLARPSQEIKLSEILQALEGPNAPVGCIRNPDTCPRSEICATRDIWEELKEAIDGVLESVTLQDLVERQRRKEQAAQGLYSI